MNALKNIAAAAATLLALATPSLATPVDLDFSFADGVNTVTGTATGLGVGSLTFAQKVTVTGLGTTVTFDGIGDSTNNIFLLSDPSTLSFGAFEGEKVVGGFTYSIFMNLGALAGGNAFSFSELNRSTNQTRSVDSTTAQFTAPAAVPLPAGGFLVLTGLIGLAGLRRLPRASTQSN